MRYRGYRRTGRAALNVAMAALTAGVFVSLFAVGAWRWNLLYGGAGLFAASGLALATAHFYGRQRTWVYGTARVLSASPEPVGAFGDCDLQLVINTPGIASLTVRTRQHRVSAHLWPVKGESLPVMVDANDRRRVRVRWDQVLPPGDGPDDDPIRTTPRWAPRSVQ